MDRKKALSNAPKVLKTFEDLNELNLSLESHFLEKHSRSLPFPDHLNDRWERAKRLGFGEGSSIYDSSYVLGEVSVGVNCWIGMFTILDGSGKLTIGNNCTISASVHIYSHDNLKATLSNNKTPIERNPVAIGDNCYIAPHSIIAKGVTLGNNVVVASHSLVNKSFPDNSIVAGTPAKIIGKVEIIEGKINLIYSK